MTQLKSEFGLTLMTAFLSMVLVVAFVPSMDVQTIARVTYPGILGSYISASVIRLLTTNFAKETVFYTGVGLLFLLVARYTFLGGLLLMVGLHIIYSRRFS